MRWKITVERTYTARHIHTRVIEAATAEEAERLVADQLEADEFDPTDTYDNSAEEDGYDDCGPWHVETCEEAQLMDEVTP